MNTKEFIEKANKILNWYPRIDLKEVVDIHRDYYINKCIKKIFLFRNVIKKLFYLR